MSGVAQEGVAEPGQAGPVGDNTDPGAVEDAAGKSPLTGPRKKRNDSGKVRFSSIMKFAESFPWFKVFYVQRRSSVPQPNCMATGLSQILHLIVFSGFSSGPLLAWPFAPL
mmetsp:Transcript_41642/g.64986  ORF Transcript_41642/g.64986 Transcript_41642/m.64986 type:complete len:111 (-) Transcript_41642:1772-2104(-)